MKGVERMPWWAVLIIALVSIFIGAYAAVLYIGHGIYRNM
jgi:hypothetical protein